MSQKSRFLESVKKIYGIEIDRKLCLHEADKAYGISVSNLWMMWLEAQRNPDDKKEMIE